MDSYDLGQRQTAGSCGRGNGTSGSIKCVEFPYFAKELLASLVQCFPTSVRPRPGKFFFHTTRARSQKIYS